MFQEILVPDDNYSQASLVKQGGSLVIANGLCQSVIKHDDEAVEEKAGAWVYRLYPYFAMPDLIQPPFTVQMEVKVQSKLLNALTDRVSWNNGIVGPDIFSDWGISAVQVTLNWDYSTNGGRLILYHAGSGNNGNIGVQEPDAPVFYPDTWMDIAVTVNSDRKVYLFQDGKCVATTDYPAECALQMRAFHPGLYVWNWVGRSAPIEGMYEVQHIVVRGNLPE